MVRMGSPLPDESVFVGGCFYGRCMSPTAARQNELLDQLAADNAAQARDFAARVRRLAELAAIAEDDASGVEQFVEMELAGTVRKGRVAAANELKDAVRFVEALPLTLDLLAAGELFVHQAQVLLSVTENCPQEVARLVEARVLPDCAELAPPDLRRKVKRAVLHVESELDSDAVMDRLQQARAKRRVWTQPQDDGMADIGCRAPAEGVRQWELHMEQLVLQEKAADRAAGVWRSADQIRADLVLAMPRLLLEARQRDGLGRAVPSKDALVNVFVPVATLLEVSHQPGDLDGYGPISGEHVRLVMADARLRRVLVDGESGQPLSIDPDVLLPAADDHVTRQRLIGFLRMSSIVDRLESQHDPSPELRRFVEVRDGRCRGVGCTPPAKRCHKDHKRPYPKGPTAAGNLGSLSARCHRAKHNGWQLRPEPDGGTTWTSPLGRVYRRPPAYDPPHIPPRLPRRPARLLAEPPPDADGD